MTEADLYLYAKTTTYVPTAIDSAFLRWTRQTIKDHGIPHWRKRTELSFDGYCEWMSDNIGEAESDFPATLKSIQNV
jgi:hypothetical protein